MSDFLVPQVIIDAYKALDEQLAEQTRALVDWMARPVESGSGPVVFKVHRQEGHDA